MNIFQPLNIAGAICLTLSFQSSLLAQQSRQWGQDRSITQVSKSAYRFGSDNQYGAYVLTSEGIIVVDGHYCQSNATAWLKSELDRR